MEAEAAAEERTGTAWLKEERAFRLRRWVCCWVSWSMDGGGGGGGGGGSKGKEELRGIMGNGRGLSADRQANLPAGPTQERCVSLERRAGPAAPPHN